MARDTADKSTRNLPLERRGRPTKHGGEAMTAAERQAEHRARMKARGYKQVTVFVPADMTPAQVQQACDEWQAKQRDKSEVDER